IAAVIVRPNPQFKHEPQLAIRRVDGTETAISWHKCFNGATPRADALHALRHAIADQVIAARDAAFARGAVVCPYTQGILAMEDAHVDHAWPCEFTLMVKTWLAQHDLQLEDLVLTYPDEGSAIMVDRAQIASWCAFHRRYARLLVISATANLTLRR